MQLITTELCIALVQHLAPDHKSMLVLHYVLLLGLIEWRSFRPACALGCDSSVGDAAASTVRVASWTSRNLIGIGRGVPGAPQFFDLLHEPAVAYEERLPSEDIALSTGEKQDGARDLVDRGELAVHRVLQHHVADDVVLGDAEFAGLFGDLVFQRAGSLRN